MIPRTNLQNITDSKIVKIDSFNILSSQEAVVENFIKKLMYFYKLNKEELDQITKPQYRAYADAVLANWIPSNKHYHTCINKINYEISFIQDIYLRPHTKEGKITGEKRFQIIEAKNVKSLFLSDENRSNQENQGFTATVLISQAYFKLKHEPVSGKHSIKTIKKPAALKVFNGKMITAKFIEEEGKNNLRLYPLFENKHSNSLGAKRGLSGGCKGLQNVKISHTESESKQAIEVKIDTIPGYDKTLSALLKDETWLSKSTLTDKIYLVLYIALCLRKLHNEMNYAHLDLKPDNIMVDYDPEEKISRVRLIDFGFSRENGKSRYPSGTASYFDPEYVCALIENSPSVKIADIRLDVYAFGILCCEILFDKKINDYLATSDIFNHYLQVRSQKDKSTDVTKLEFNKKKGLIEEKIPQCLRDMIEGCLKPSKDRIAIDEAVKLLYKMLFILEKNKITFGLFSAQSVLDIEKEVINNSKRPTV